jgi:hypothetical protein
MSTRFFTNDNSNTLLKKFEGIFENNPDLARFDALVGYLRASGDFANRIFYRFFDLHSAEIALIESSFAR